MATQAELLDATSLSRTFVLIDPGTPDFAFFRPLLHYWQDRCAGRPAPSRRDIDPLDLPPALLPHMVLIDIEREPLDFRYRLSGTLADTIHGQSLKGLRILDLRPERFAELLHGDLVRMTEDLAVQFVLHTFTNRQGKVRRFRVLRLPLCDASGRLEMVLALADHGLIQR